MARRNIVEILYQTAFDDRGARAAEQSTKKQTDNFERLTGAVRTAVAGYASIKTAQLAYQAVVEGADLIRQQQQFDALATSIGTTAGALRSDMMDATGQLIAQSDLVAGAVQMMNLGLASSHDEVVRLSKVVGTLGWDMDVLTLTLANQSTMRLDSLGLSIESVKGRAEELADAGYTVEDAFRLAVIEAGEAKIGLLGDTADSTAGDVRVLQATAKDMLDTFKTELAAELADDLNDLADAARNNSDAMQEAATSSAQYIGWWVEEARKIYGAFALITDTGRLVEQGEMSAGTHWRLTLEALLGDTEAALEEWRRIQVEMGLIEIELPTGPTQGPQTLLEYMRQLEQAGPKTAGAFEEVASGAIDSVRAMQRLIETAPQTAEALSTIDEAAQIQNNMQAARDAIERTNAVLDVQRQRAKDAAAALGDEYAIAVRDVAENAGDEDGGAANAIGDMNQEMFNLIDQAGGGPQLLFNWAEQTELLGEEALKASLKVFAMREKMEQLAQDLVAGKISAEDARLELEAFREELEAIDSLEGTRSFVFDVDVPGIQDLRELRDFLNSGGTVNPGDPLFGPGSPSIDQPSDNRPPPSSSTPPPPPGDATPPPGAFALGGTIAPGWNIVGEQGPEMLHGTTGEVIPANSTRMLAGGGGGGSTSLNQNITLVSQDNNTAALQAALIARQSRRNIMSTIRER